MHLYLHIPFCESKCHYCAFTSLRLKDEKAYMDALLKDLISKKSLFEKEKITTLFIGGGTPSCVKARHFERIFDFLQPFLASKCELTSEANPSSASFNWLKKMKELGLNRLSFGAQSFNEKKLHFLGRIHSSKQIFKAFENALKAGFKNLNIDLIYDTKLDDKKMLEFELKELSKLDFLTHVSAYSLSIEKNTAFAKRPKFKKNAPLLASFFIKELEKLGFKQYEISNFCKKGFKCKHNLAYWQGKNYLACGLSGVSFYENARFYTRPNLKAYIKEPLFRSKELLSKQDLNLEHLFLGLRSCVGIKKARLDESTLQRANLLLEEKKLEFKRGSFFNKNFLLADELVLFLQS
ncbi:coproporphyrinogen III oxidase family protein [Campylobacter sp. MIT 99-7217]|uniref:radical SAM family heme chaperone HemW n=1 Tax=Campylobacter sp. MIT 99-7217 TaxID=535091 RepID=UPI00115C1B90|nr:radical SAM family heme chaperone HemW [Campylobacter sp. MIT 99-7217]TQR33722.1 coproporphyrinogen III oxidase family protein [Campylobacter sp. MIT 99-7217]